MTEEINRFDKDQLVNANQNNLSISENSYYKTLVNDMTSPKNQDKSVKNEP